MKTFILLSYLLVFSFVGCRKQKTDLTDNGLPPATQKGANIFACRLNGKPFIAYSDKDHLGATVHSDSLLIGGAIKGNYYESIFIRIKNPTIRPAIYSLSDTSNQINILTDSTCKGIIYTLLDNHGIGGAIQITRFDTTQNIVSGKFTGLIPIPDCDTLHITDGRFDIRYK